MADDDDDERDLFERALDEMTPDQLFEGKYGGRGQSPPSPTPKVDPNDAEEIQRLRDQRMMESAFSGIDRMERSKYHKRQAPPIEHPVPAPVPQPEAPPAAPSSVTQPEPEPDLAASCAPADRLNLRGIKSDRAIVKLALFIDLATKDDKPVIGVVVGNDDELRRAAIEWFRGPGTVYVRRLEVNEPDGDTRIYAALRKGSP